MAQIRRPTPLPRSPSGPVSPESRRVRDSVRALLDAAVPTDGGHTTPWPDGPRLVADGWLELSLPVSVGGGGLDLAGQVVLHEEVGRSLAGSDVLVRAGLVLPLLLACTGPESAEILGRVLDGTSVPLHLDGRDGRVLADSRVGGGMELHGRVEAAAGGVDADEIVVLCEISGAAGIAAVPVAPPGVVIEPREVLDPVVQICRVVLDGATGQRLSVSSATALADAVRTGHLLHTARVVGSAVALLEEEPGRSAHQVAMLDRIRSALHEAASPGGRLERARSLLSAAVRVYSALAGPFTGGPVPVGDRAARHRRRAAAEVLLASHGAPAVHDGRPSSSRPAGDRVGGES